MLVLLIAWLLIQLFGALKTKDPFVVIVAALGLVLWILHCVGAVHLPPCLVGG